MNPNRIWRIGKDAEFEAKHPREEDGTFTFVDGGMPGVGGDRPSDVGDFVGRMMEGVASGGFTFENKTGESAVHGISVAPFPERSGVYPAATFSRSDASEWLRKNARLLMNPGVHVGGWRDDSTGKVYLDLVKIYPQRDRDLALAVGRKRNQISVADLDAIAAGDWDHAIIPTGGTGEAVVAAKAARTGKLRFMLFPSDVTPEQLADALGEGDAMSKATEWFQSLVKFDEEEHPRHDAGSEEGGRFAPKNGGTDTTRAAADKLKGKVRQRMDEEEAEDERNKDYTPDAPRIRRPRAAPVKSKSSGGALARLREMREARSGFDKAMAYLFGGPRVPVWKNDPADAPECVAALLEGLKPGEVHKSGADQQMVAGWASVVADGNHRPIVDRQGDVIALVELEKAAKDFMALPLSKRTLDIEHDYKGVGRVTEGLMVTPLLKASLGLPKSTPLGFVIAAKVDDAAAWKRVKDRELVAFSVGGSATREPLD